MVLTLSARTLLSCHHLILFIKARLNCRVKKYGSAIWNLCQEGASFLSSVYASRLTHSFPLSRKGSDSVGLLLQWHLTKYNHTYNCGNMKPSSSPRPPRFLLCLLSLLVTYKKCSVSHITLVSLRTFLATSTGGGECNGRHIAVVTWVICWPTADVSLNAHGIES